MAGASISINIPAIASLPEQVGPRKMIMFYDNRASLPGALLELERCRMRRNRQVYGLSRRGRHRRLGKAGGPAIGWPRRWRRGTGRCVVLLHGTGAMVEDLQSSGCVEGLAAHLPPAAQRAELITTGMWHAPVQPVHVAPRSSIPFPQSLRTRLPPGHDRTIQRHAADGSPGHRAMRAEATKTISRLALVGREC